MPQLSPLNWMVLSLMVLALIFGIKVSLSFFSLKNLNFFVFKNQSQHHQKWMW